MSQLTISTDVAQKTTTILKPTAEIVKTISNIQIKKLELSEYCKAVENELKECQKKVQTLNSAINECTKMKEDYKIRNKINVINSESLFQALNELNRYKCELKSIYIATDKASKTKMLKYKSIISAYDSAWENALKEYNSNPVFVELLNIQQKNSMLVKEIEKQENLRASTELQFNQLKDNIQKTFLEKVVDFAEVMIQYREYLHSSKRNIENECLDKNLTFKLFKTDLTITGKTNLDNSDDANSTSIDVSMFDDIMVPSENLESQISEEDILIHQDGKQLYDMSKSQEDLSNSQQNVELNDTKTMRNTKENLMNNTETVKRSENESQYFKNKTGECSEQAKTLVPQETERQNFVEDNFSKQKNNEENVNGGRNPALANLSSSGLQQMESEEDISRDVQMEYEEFIDEESYEKQCASQKENYDSQYKKTSSLSSDTNDSAPTGENNDSQDIGTIFKNEQKTGPKPKCEQDFKSFTGFFTMGNDNDTSMPSIFKLF